MRRNAMYLLGLVCPALLMMGVCAWGAGGSEEEGYGPLESLTIGLEPSTSMKIEETTVRPVAPGSIVAKSDVGLRMWSLGATLKLPSKFKLSLSYATGSGDDGSPTATVGGVPAPAVPVQLDRQDYEAGLLYPLFEAKQTQGSMLGVRLIGRLSYHKTTFKLPTFARDTYQGCILGVSVTKPLSPQWTGELTGSWMPKLKGGEAYDTVDGNGTYWSIGAVYTPPQSRFFYRVAWKQSRYSGDTTDAGALSSIPGATKFSFDEKYSGLFLSAGLRL